MLTRVALLCALMIPASAANGPLIDYVTYLGGSYTDTPVGLAIDSTGAAYIAGNTNSPDFPVTSTKLGAPEAISGCAFVTKLNPTGNAIDFSICLAGWTASAFAMDPSGNLYLAGLNTTTSTYGLAKLDPTGQTLLYTFTTDFAPESLVVDSTGNVYLAGAAGPALKTTSGAYQASYTGCKGSGLPDSQECANAFVLKLSAAGNVAWATYLGGSVWDDAHALAVDLLGNVWVVGETASPDFPVTAGAVSQAFHGEIDLGPLRFGDAFVAKLDATGGHLLYSTYLGGSGADGALSVAVDPTGNAYVAGGTQSLDFPTTVGALWPTYSGTVTGSPSLIGNGFLAKFDFSGGLIYSTFTGAGQANPVLADTTDQAYVGQVQVAEGGATLPGCNWTPAASIINASGSAVVASSPIPGRYLAWDGKGGLYSAGLAYALVFFTTPRAFQTEYGGDDSDAFAAKVDFTQPAAPMIASVVNSANFSPGYASPFPNGSVAPGELVTLFGSGFGDDPVVLFSQFRAPVTYASSCQINAVVPFEVQAGLNTFVTVGSSDLTMGPVKLPVTAAAPGIFTLTGTGAGQAAVLNQDYTVNSAKNPAARGSVISVFLTGTGELSPAIGDGSLGPTTPPFPEPLAAISATIGGVAATVKFAGQAPGLIAGVTQVNLEVPEGSPTGVAAITIYAAGYASQLQQAVTIAVK